jgi:hypothetical protein
VTRGVAILGAAICLVALLLGISPALAAWEVRAGLVVASLGGLILLYRLDAQRERREKQAADGANLARFNELARRAEAPGFSLSVRGSALIVMSLLGLLVGLLLSFAALESEGWLSILGAIFFVGLGLAGALRGLQGLGKPVIVLSSEGFTTPQIPLMPWTEVYGIALQEIRTKGELVGHMLSFRIDGLPRLVRGTGLLYRATYALSWGAGRKTIKLPLRGTDVHPDVVLRIARLLWTKATGRDYFWDPLLSEQANLALRASDDLLERMKKTDDPAEFRRLADEMQSNSDVAPRELRDRMRQIYWLVAAATVLFVLYTAWRVFITP